MTATNRCSSASVPEPLAVARNPTPEGRVSFGRVSGVIVPLCDSSDTFAEVELNHFVLAFSTHPWLAYAYTYKLRVMVYTNGIDALTYSWLMDEW